MTPQVYGPPYLLALKGRDPDAPETRTTVMIRNLPNPLMRADVLKFIDEIGYYLARRCPTLFLLALGWIVTQ